MPASCWNGTGPGDCPTWRDIGFKKAISGALGEQQWLTVVISRLVNFPDISQRGRNARLAAEFH